MTVKDKQLAKYKRLNKQGCTPDQIMEKMGISKRTYFRYQDAAKQDNRRKTIDLRKYHTIVMQGYDDKVVLGAQLGISKQTLIKCEKEHDVCKRMARGLYARGKSQTLPRMLHISAERAKEYTNGMPTLAGAIKSLNIIADTLDDFAEFDPTATDDANAIRKALAALETVKVNYRQL